MKFVLIQESVVSEMELIKAYNLQCKILNIIAIIFFDQDLARSQVDLNNFKSYFNFFLYYLLECFELKLKSECNPLKQLCYLNFFEYVPKVIGQHYDRTN
jgi:hypothetical protein